MKKASEHLAKLLELSVPQAAAEELVKSAIAKGDLEDDLETAATVDATKFKALLDELRKSGEPDEAETLAKSNVADVRDDLPSKDMKKMFDAIVKSHETTTSRLFKAQIQLGEMVAVLSDALVSIDRRQGDLAKSMADATPVIAPKAVTGALSAVASPLDTQEAAKKFDEVIQLRKSASNAIKGELEKGDASRVASLTSALREVGFSSDPRAVATRVGITL